MTGSASSGNQELPALPSLLRLPLCERASVREELCPFNGRRHGADPGSRQAPLEEQCGGRYPLIKPTPASVAAVDGKVGEVAQRSLVG
jgi:hypothetical protein